MNQPMQQTQQRRPPELVSRLQGIIGRLETDAKKRVGKRKSLEDRWIEDLQQYHGKYDSETERELNKGQKSKLFINQTQPKTDAMTARLMDLLFPTDDRNWGIGPTPVPKLTKSAENAVAKARELREQAEMARQAAEAEAAQADPQKLEQAKALEEQAEIATQRADELQETIGEGKKRAELMSETMDDQLKECQYHAACRDMLDDGVRLGTGIIKGPVTGDRVRKGWKQVEEQDAEGVSQKTYKLQVSEGDNPAYRWVNIWHFFPDMDARTIEESEGEYERHLYNRKALRGLAKLSGFDKDAIRRLIRMEPQGSAPSYLADLRNITGTNEEITSDLYHVWEYNGPLSSEDMRDIALAMGDVDTLGELEEIDPLTELKAVVWFCQNEILKFSIYPMDSGETLYSVFNLMKDEASIFGKGIPAIMRDPQKSLNASWRAMMDNAGLSSGPQIVVDESQVEPADGKWEITPRKVWRTKNGIQRDKRAFETFNIPMMQVELANIIELSKRFIDDMTSMPAIAQGDQATQPQTTATGMSLMMNSANVVFRRIVKNFDDDVTVPNIRRLYDWNMQFNPDEAIKGDYEVDARGSSVLLVKEMQAQNLFMIAVHLGAHPIYGPMLKQRNVLKRLFQAHMIPADEVLLTENEIDEITGAASAEAEAAKAQSDVENAKIELEREKFEGQVEMANMKYDREEALADMKFRHEMALEVTKQETQLMVYAEKMNVEADKLAAMLQDRREQRETELTKEEIKAASAERKLAAEVAATAELGPTGGGVL